MEVVLANSTVVAANESHNADLFWALRGGGNNFGIVTSVQIEAFRNPPEWYVFQVWDIAHSDAVFERLAMRTGELGAMARSSDPDTTRQAQHVWQTAITLEWNSPTGAFVITERRVQSRDLGDDVTDATDELALHTSSYRKSVLEMSQKMSTANPAGKFNFFGSVTVANDPTLFVLLSEIFEEEVLGILDARGVQAFVVYNPLHQATIQKMQVRGGNALGIEVEDGPLMSECPSFGWIASPWTMKLQIADNFPV